MKKQQKKSDAGRALPKAGADGTFKRDGETWGTIAALTKRLSIGTHPLAQRVKSASCKSMTGKMEGGRVANFYPLAEVTKACADLVGKRPRKGKAVT